MIRYSSAEQTSSPKTDWGRDNALSDGLTFLKKFTVTRHCHGDYIVLGDFGQWSILAGATVLRLMYIVLLIDTI
jgi:hypothetical protein